MNFSKSKSFPHGPDQWRIAKRYENQKNIAYTYGVRTTPTTRNTIIALADPI